MSTQDDYDKLSPEEREIRDKADRQREAQEQAGRSVVGLRCIFIQKQTSPALFLETSLARRRRRGARS